MLTYNITLKCDRSNCPAVQNATATVRHPSEYAIPTITSWSGPWEKWLVKEDEPTLCPAHKKEKEEREKAQEQEQEQGAPRDPIASA